MKNVKRNFQNFEAKFFVLEIFEKISFLSERTNGSFWEMSFKKKWNRKSLINISGGFWMIQLKKSWFLLTNLLREKKSFLTINLFASKLRRKTEEKYWENNEIRKFSTFDQMNFLGNSFEQEFSWFFIQIKTGILSYQSSKNI